MSPDDLRVLVNKLVERVCAYSREPKYFEHRQRAFLQDYATPSTRAELSALFRDWYCEGSAEDPSLVQQEAPGCSCFRGRTESYAAPCHTCGREVCPHCRYDVLDHNGLLQSTACDRCLTEPATGVPLLTVPPVGCGLGYYRAWQDKDLNQA